MQHCLSKPPLYKGTGGTARSVRVEVLVEDADRMKVLRKVYLVEERWAPMLPRTECGLKACLHSPEHVERIAPEELTRRKPRLLLPQTRHVHPYM